MMTTRKPRLIQCEPPAMFEAIAPKTGAHYWKIAIRDATDSFQRAVHFECRDKSQRFSYLDMLKAGGRECQNGEGFVTVTRFQDNIPVEMHRAKAHYQFGHWAFEEM